MEINKKKDKLFKELINAMISSLTDFNNHIVSIDEVDYEVSAILDKYDVTMYIYKEFDQIVSIHVPRTNSALFELSAMAETYFKMKERFSKDKGE